MLTQNNVQENISVKRFNTDAHANNTIFEYNSFYIFLRVIVISVIYRQEITSQSAVCPVRIRHQSLKLIRRHQIYSNTATH